MAVAVSNGGGVNHGLHAVLTLLTCGAWLPIWLIVAIFGGGGGSSAVAIGGGGAGGTNVRVGSNNKAPLIVGAVFLGMVLLGAGAQHPWLFIPLFLLAGAGGFSSGSRRPPMMLGSWSFASNIAATSSPIAPITRTSCGTKAILAAPTVGIRHHRKRA